MKKIKLKYTVHKALLKLSILLSLTFVVASASTENVRKVNTDLTAAVVRDTVLGAGNVVAVVAPTVGSYSETSERSNGTSSVDAGRPEGIGTHVCVREETYVEETRVPEVQPVRIRSSTWCLEFPPRCSKYRTEMREIVKFENTTKTRTIRFCCAGYEGNISINDTICKPVCRGGCGRGRCQTPDNCSCEPGYTGKHCTQRCDHDRWGDECRNECQCRNGAVCDNKTGLCHCTAGWAGQFCELPCPLGTYDIMCLKTCACPNQRCHPKTGDCEGHEKSPPPLTPHPNATHIIMQTLNSTINNITHNLDRIAKNIGTPTAPPPPSPPTLATLPPVPIILELTTAPPPPPEVILIKHHNEPHHTPRFIVHQAGVGLLDELNAEGGRGAAAVAAGKEPDVIHVITAGWQHGVTAAKAVNETAGGAAPPPPSTVPAATASEHDAQLLTTMLIVLLIITIVIAAGFLYVYRRYHWQRAQVEAALAARSGGHVELGPGETGVTDATVGGGSGKHFLKPLPDLPAFSQMVRNKVEGPEFYDTPSNNSSIKTGYDYARKESLYSVVSAKSRKSSPDSHLYDEIRYPNAAHSHHSHHHLQHLHQQATPNLPHLQRQHVSAGAAIYVAPQQPAMHHVSQLIIPAQNSNYLQVPTMSLHAGPKKITHI